MVVCLGTFWFVPETRSCSVFHTFHASENLRSVLVPSDSVVCLLHCCKLRNPTVKQTDVDRRSAECLVFAVSARQIISISPCREGAVLLLRASSCSA
jgi:hypothetical protein